MKGIPHLRFFNKNRMKIKYGLFIKLWLQKKSGCKTFRITISTICTTDQVISTGGEYQYKEGGMLEAVIIEEINFKNFFLEVTLYFIEMDRRITCFHRMVDAGYVGMWRIWDKGHYDIEEWRKEREEIDLEGLDSIPVIRI